MFGAESFTSKTEKTDAATCEWIIASLKAIAADRTLGPQLLKKIPEKVIEEATNQDCTTVTSSGPGSLDAAGRISPMAYGVTYGFWKKIHASIAGWSVFQWNVNVGIRWSSASSYSVKWGADCYLTSVPGYFGGYDSGGWCGVYNPGMSGTAEPGSNFWVSPVPLPLWKRWGWMRYYAYSNGGSSTVRGGWS